MSKFPTDPVERLEVLCKQIEVLNEATRFKGQVLLQTLVELGVSEKIEGTHISVESSHSAQTPLKQVVEFAANGFWRMKGDTVHSLGGLACTTYRNVTPPLIKVFKAFEKRRHRLYFSIKTC